MAWSTQDTSAEVTHWRYLVHMWHLSEEIQQHARCRSRPTRSVTVKPYVCSECPKRFCTAVELRHHHPVHSKYKRFSCCLCDRLYKHRRTLRDTSRNVQMNSCVVVMSPDITTLQLHAYFVTLNCSCLVCIHLAVIGLYYDTIRDAILTCARKPTWIALIYRTETTTKNCKTEKLKSKSI